MLLSIILPSYNVSPYIKSCVESILDSGMSRDVYEILIIDDGSTDSTAQVGKKLSESFSHIFYYSQQNRGVSAARNFGLSKAKNKFVWFIDPDDIVNSALVVDLVYMIVDSDLDALAMNFYGIAEDDSLLSKAKKKLDLGGKKFMSGGEFYSLNYKRSYIWQYIFRKEIFLSHEIRFKEDMIMEDSEILPKLMANIYRIGVFAELVYGYRRRNTSLLRTNSPESELNFINSVILLAESIKCQMKQYSGYKGLAQGLVKKYIQVNQILFLKFIGGNWDKAQRIKLISTMRKCGVFPFDKIINLSPLMNIRLNTWRLLINILPIQISEIYGKINRSYK